MNPLVVCRGFELTPSSDPCVAALFEFFEGGLPAEGLLGAARLALRVALKGDQLRRTAKLSNRLVVCRGFELRTVVGSYAAAVFGTPDEGFAG
jgi:hypothetical protein